MHLRYGKTGWLKLQHMQLESHLEHKVRIFEPAVRSAAYAAVAANAVTARTFAKAVNSYAPLAERVALGADTVRTAVFRDEGGRLRVVYREVVVRFERRAPAKLRRALLEKFGLKIRVRNRFHGDQLIAFDPSSKYAAERMVELANRLTETDEVAFAFPNFVSEFERMKAPTPIGAQWHLGTVEARKGWATTLGGKVTIAIIDDGVDIGHPNLKGNIRRNPDPDQPLDKYGRDFFVGEDAPDHFDPRPKNFRSPYHVMDGNDIHGTPCAGVAAASGAVDGVRGAAPEARILPVKVFHGDQLATESRVADAIRYASRFADILSCSWKGPESPDIQSAIEEAAEGRKGRGCPVFCATGNDSAASVGFPARLKAAIAVGASTRKEVRADYSNFGAEVSIVAPSSGDKAGIFTTDVSTPNRGFNVGDEAAGGLDGLHTNDFGGTSSATPLAAGVAALMLSANPDLTGEQVRTILQDTAVKIGPANGYNKKGRSRAYGFGRIDAAAAVRAALALAAGAAKPRAKKKKKKVG